MIVKKKKRKEDKANRQQEKTPKAGQTVNGRKKLRHSQTESAEDEEPQENPSKEARGLKELDKGIRHKGSRR
jgi:hypothetical protein